MIARWLTWCAPAAIPRAAREFEPSSQAIRNWVAQADRQEGRREEKGAPLAAAERGELARLRRREQAAAAGARHPLSSCCLVRTRGRHDPVRVFEFMSASGCLPGRGDGTRARRVGIRFSRLAEPASFCTHCGRRRVAETHPHGPRQLARNLRRTPHPCRTPGTRREARARADRAADAAAGLAGASRRGGSVVTTRRDQDARPAPTWWTATSWPCDPNQALVADIAFVPTASGFLYLAVVLDAWSAQDCRAGGWPSTCAPSWCSKRWRWRSANAADSVVHRRDQGRPVGGSLAFGSRCRKRACAHPWARSVTPTTMPCAACSPPLVARPLSCWVEGWVGWRPRASRHGGTSRG